MSLVGSYNNVMGLNCAISEHDDIFGFFLGHHSSRNPLRGTWLTAGVRFQS